MWAVVATLVLINDNEIFPFHLIILAVDGLYFIMVYVCCKNVLSCVQVFDICLFFVF